MQNILTVVGVAIGVLDSRENEQDVDLARMLQRALDNEVARRVRVQDSLKELSRLSKE